jgi:N-sulfoglucosamine sulfohydrolase
MLMMRGPGGFTGGKVCDSMISQIDLFPTICQLIDVKPPDWLQGRSFLPVLRGEKAEINDEIFAEVTYHAAYEPKRAVRTHRWKYIRHFGDRDQPVLPNCDDGLSKDLWLEMGWRNQHVAKEQLYDLVFDPTETRNLIADSSAKGAAGEMRGRLDQWMQRTKDPILNGPIKAPPGAKANDPAGTSPKEPVIDVG